MTPAPVAVAVAVALATSAVDVVVVVVVADCWDVAFCCASSWAATWEKGEYVGESEVVTFTHCSHRLCLKEFR